MYSKIPTRSKDKYLAILEELPDIVYKIDPTGHFTFINKSVRILGYEPEELIGQHFSKIVHPDDVKCFSRNYILPKYKGKITGDANAPRLFDERRTGKRKTKDLVIRLIPNKQRGVTKEVIGMVIAFGEVNSTGHYNTDVHEKNKEFLGTLGIIRDITERKKAEEKLHYQADLLQNVSNAIISTDLDSKIRTWNRAAEAMYGWEAYEVLGKHLDKVTKSKYSCDQVEILKQIVEKGYWKGEVMQKTKDRTSLTVYSSVCAIKDHSGKPAGMVTVNHDITRRKKTEDQIRASLAEKEVLLKEIHHRVKNNLQIICSLLSLQSKYIDDKRYLQFFKETQNRINSMALMHENLYQSKDLANVYLNDYVNDLLKHLSHSHSIIPGNIVLNTSVENISIDIDTAVPFGLIINELVSNSLKHAFPANIENPRTGRKDEIKIDLQSVEDQIILTVSDNGVGFPENLDFRNTESLGLQLVNILTEQLGGTITLGRRGGTTFKIRFIQPKLVKNKESKRKKVVK